MCGRVGSTQHHPPLMRTRDLHTVPAVFSRRISGDWPRVRASPLISGNAAAPAAGGRLWGVGVRVRG